MWRSFCISFIWAHSEFAANECVRIQMDDECWPQHKSTTTTTAITRTWKASNNIKTTRTKAQLGIDSRKKTTSTINIDAKCVCTLRKAKRLRDIKNWSSQWNVYESAGMTRDWRIEMEIVREIDRKKGRKAGNKDWLNLEAKTVECLRMAWKEKEKNKKRRKHKEWEENKT